MKKIKNKVVLIFFGPPGSGKGTQAEILSEKIKLPIISPGNLLRHEIEKKTKQGKLAEKYVHVGKLVPVEIIEEIMNKRLKKNDLDKGFILDGYPRNKKQLVLLNNKFLKFIKTDDIVRAIHIDVGNKEILYRMGGRRVCDCGDTYHLKFNPPKKKGICDECGKKLYIRDDDRPIVVKKRLKSFYKDTDPIIDFYKKEGKLIVINGEQSIKKVHSDLMKKISAIG